MRDLPPCPSPPRVREPLAPHGTATILGVLPDLPLDADMRLTTSHLDLAPLISEDATNMFLVMADPALGRWTGDAPPADADELRTRYVGWTSRRSPSREELWLNWAVRRRGDDRAVGHLAATVSKTETAIAWIVGTACQHQGVATESARADRLA